MSITTIGKITDTITVTVHPHDIRNVQITNADRIRNMTDEELANAFAMISDCISCSCGSAEDDCSIVDGTCQRQWLNWLRKEANSQDLHTP